jgi:hypothetical protein
MRNSRERQETGERRQKFAADGRARPSAGGRGPNQPTPLLRVRVRLHRRRLDHQLAAGFDPQTSGEHALRACQLTDPSTRRLLARSLRRVVSRAENRRAAAFGSAIPVCRKVLPWCEGLLGLAERLDGREPVNASGVARTLLLLTDGAGPIFNPAPRQSIGEAVWSIADGLRADEGHEA